MLKSLFKSKFLSPMCDFLHPMRSQARFRHQLMPKCKTGRFAGINLEPEHGKTETKNTNLPEQ
jgi:hypothetical protein